MSTEWQVRSVKQDGDRVHIELQELDSSIGGDATELFKFLAVIAVIAVIAWMFGAWDTSQSAVEHRAWSAAPGQQLTCGDKGTRSVTFDSSEGGAWQVTMQDSTGLESIPVQVQVTATGAQAQGPGAEFVYDRAQGTVHRRGYGAWIGCRVTTAG